MKRLIYVPLIAIMLAVSAVAPVAGSVYHHWSETPAEVQAAHEPEVIQAWIDAYWVNEWVRAYNFNRWMEEAARREREVPPCHSPHQSRCSVQGIEVCNGVDLLPCYVLYRESRFDPRAQNPRSSAYGLAQFLAGTWRSVCPEYPHRGSTVAQQAECIRRLYDHGRGKSHWRATL